MKTKASILALFFLSTIINSCAKKDIEHKEKETTGFTELVVPADFDWKMSENVTCNFTSEHVSKVYVSTGANTTPFASFYVGQDVDQVKLNIPTYINTLYVKYETKAGLPTAKALDITNNTVTYAVPADSEEVETVLAYSAKTNLSRGNDQAVIFYPARENGWGTLMFEDLWPAYGDYDFNDLVVNYKMQLYPNNKNMVKEMILGIRVKAIGGSLPYDLCLAIKGIKAGEIDEFEKQESNNALENADMELLNPGNSEKKPPIFRFNNIRTNTKAPKGFAFLNTDPDKKARIQEGDMVNITFYITFRNSIPQADLTLDAFDFFIAKPVKEKASQWQEIHTRGYAPTEEFGQNVYEQTKEGNSYIGKSSIYYTSNSNLIWAINVPTDIPHTYEKADFLKAYPHFKDWATSGGNQNKDWYENTTGNRNDSYLIKQ